MPGEPRALRVAVTGSAGVGKTTLAQALSGSLGMPLVREEMREHLEATCRRLEGRPPAEVAAVLEGLWRRRKESEGRLAAFVADNCALDFAAYAVHLGATAGATAGITAGATPGATGTAAAGRRDGVATLLREASEAARRYDAIFLLPWGAIPYRRDGVRSDDPQVERRYQLLLEALLARHADATRVHRVPDGCRALPHRLAWALDRLEPGPRRAGAEVAP